MKNLESIHPAHETNNDDFGNMLNNVSYFTMSAQKQKKFIAAILYMIKNPKILEKSDEEAKAIVREYIQTL